MRFSFIVLMLVVGLVGWNPQEAGARPKQGDKTLNLSTNHFTWTKISERACDGNGENCQDTGETTSTSIGLGLSGGYLLTDLIEVGIGVGLTRTSSKYEPNAPSAATKNSDWDLPANGYMKLHLGSDEKMVPFVAGGLGLDMMWSKYESGQTTQHSGAAEIFIFAEGGIDYYIAEKYAISGFLGITRAGFAEDDDTKSDLNPIYGHGIWTISLGLGITTYF